MPLFKGRIKPKRVFRKRNVMRTMATQVNSRDIDDTLDGLCQDPDTTFDIYRQNLFLRKKEKYKNIFVGGRVQKTSCTTLCKPIVYQFGPLTIHKNSRYL